MSQPENADRAARLGAYTEKLDQLKARQALREVLERDLLLEFIRLNRGNINEFPLLESQQNSVINLISQRGGEHPAYDYVRKLVGNFVTLLTRFAREGSGPDQERAEEIRALLDNTETLLIRCIQGVVYAMGLITDNFEEIVLRHFGQGGMQRFNSLIEQMEIDQAFWRAFIERFAASQVQAAFTDIMVGERYHLTKEGQQILIRYDFDDVLARLNPVSQGIDKTRIQAAFARTGSDPEAARTYKVVLSCLAKGLGYIPSEILSRDDVEFVARIVCIDPAAEGLRDRYLAFLTASKNQSLTPEQAEREKRSVQFLVEQAVAAGVGATIAVGVTRDNFSAALSAFFPGAGETIRSIMGTFDFDSLEKALFYLLENQFLHLLRTQAEGEGGKVQVRSLRTRRCPLAQVDALAPQGLNRIRRGKIWHPDRHNPDMLLFRPRTARELASLMVLLQMEEPLSRQVYGLWEKGSSKTECVAVIDMDQVARTSTNAKAKLAEILSKFGIRPSKPQNQAPAAQ